MKDFLTLVSTKQLVFDVKPKSLPADLRPEYRIYLIILILYITARHRRSSLRKLYLLNWAIKTVSSRSELIFFVTSDANIKLAIRYEPSMGRAIDFALAEKVIRSESNARVILTSLGESIAMNLLESKCMEGEIAFLKEIGLKLTEAKVQNIFRSSRFSL